MIAGFDPRELVARGIASGLITPGLPKAKQPPAPRIFKYPPTSEGERRRRHRLYMEKWRKDNRAHLLEAERSKRAENMKAGLRADGKPRVRKMYRPRSPQMI